MKLPKMGNTLEGFYTISDWELPEEAYCLEEEIESYISKCEQ